MYTVKDIIMTYDALKGALQESYKLIGSYRGVGEGGAGGAVAPPTFESWGAQPLQFFTSLCAVVIVWLYGDYSPIIRILQYYNW